MDYKTRIMSKLHRCNICGAKIWMQGYHEKNRISNIMKKERICYDCAFWSEIIHYPPKNFEVLNGTALRILPPAEKKDKSIILGGKGKMRYFMRPDWSVFCSNDVWVVGKVPDRFICHLPDTAREITQKAFNNLKRHNKKCEARGCFDRYRCFRYDKSLEEEKGTFNEVPKNWKVGGERCRYFIDIQDMKSD